MWYERVLMLSWRLPQRRQRSRNRRRSLSRGRKTAEKSTTDEEGEPLPPPTSVEVLSVVKRIPLFTSKSSSVLEATQLMNDVLFNFLSRYLCCFWSLLVFCLCFIQKNKPSIRQAQVTLNNDTVNALYDFPFMHRHPFQYLEHFLCSLCRSTT